MVEVAQLAVLLGSAALGAYVFGELKPKRYITFLLVAALSYLAVDYVMPALSLSTFTLYGVFSTMMVKAMILGAAARASAKLI